MGKDKRGERQERRPEARKGSHGLTTHAEGHCSQCPGQVPAWTGVWHTPWPLSIHWPCCLSAPVHKLLARCPRERAGPQALRAIESPRASRSDLVCWVLIGAGSSHWQEVFLSVG